MCGRFALHATQVEISTHFKSKGNFVMAPRYNIAPTQMLPVIVSWHSQIEFCRWGFIPSWIKAQNEEIPPGFINARLETLLEKPSFKDAIIHRRCLIPASGYYEWRQFGEKKQPYYVYIKNKPLIAIAGIWSFWQSSAGIIRTCAVITTSAYGDFLKLHERMPLIVPESQFENWLAKGYDFRDLAKTLQEIPPENIGIKPVSPKMNHPQFDGIECIRALV